MQTSSLSLAHVPMWISCTLDCANMSFIFCHLYHRRNVASAQLPREVTGTWGNHPDSALDPNPIGRAYRRDLSIVITKPLKSHQVQVKNWNSWTLCQIAGITLYTIISRREVFNQKSNGAFVGNIDKVSINHFNSPCGGRSLPNPQSPFGRQVGTTRKAHEYRFSCQRNGTNQHW